MAPTNPTNIISDYQQPNNVTVANTPDELACAIVRQEKMAWENSVVYVTPQVAFYLPVLLRTVLKNYYGIFDEPTDPQTGQDKTWVPLTETLCETVVKNIDLGTKDINFRALNQDVIQLTKIVRAAVRQHLNKIFFGEKLKEALRHLAIWGTVVWSTEEINKEVDVRLVNLLNFYIEPTSPSIAEADKVTERFPMTLSEFRTKAKANNWKNWKDVTGRINVPRYDSWLQLQNYPSNTLFVEVYRLRGMAPKFIITGEEKDRDELVSVELIVSWDNGTWRFHEATLRKNNKNKGYEEAWFTRVPQRWLGRGIGEKSMPMQVYMNFLVNVRKVRSQISQIGLFKVKRGSGITSQNLRRLASNGVILVNNMDDIQDFALSESPNSIADENDVWQWAQRVTQAQEITAGEELPASTPATNAAIQNNQAQGAYALVRENTGLWLERWLKNQALPIIMKNLKIGDLIQYTGDTDEIKELDEHIINTLMINEIDKLTKKNKLIDTNQVLFERARAITKLKKYGTERFIKLDQILNPLDFGVEVMITNEKVDAGVMVNNLISMLKVAPDQSKQIVPTIFDLLGIPYVEEKSQSTQNMSQNVSQTAGAGIQNPTPNQYQLTTNANTLQA